MLTCVSYLLGNWQLLMWELPYLVMMRDMGYNHMCMSVHTHTHNTHTHAHTNTRANARAHTHTHVCSCSLCCLCYCSHHGCHGTLLYWIQVCYACKCSHKNTCTHTTAHSPNSNTLHGSPHT